MDYNEVLSKALKTIGVELKDEFDKNFENKSFFGKKWPPSDNGLVKTGDLRKSLRVQTSNSSVSIISDVEYADIHNEGGKIQVTEKMKKFFWAKYKETKSEKYKALALKKVGSYIEVSYHYYFPVIFISDFINKTKRGLKFIEINPRFQIKYLPLVIFFYYIFHFAVYSHTIE